MKKAYTQTMAQPHLRPAAAIPRCRGRCLIVLLMALLAACGGPQDSPEQRVRAMVASGEAAAEARKLSRFEDIVAQDYNDPMGRTRRDVLRLAAGYFLRNHSIHLLVHIGEIQVQDPQHARATVYVAMAGSALGGPEQLLALQADLYRFDLRLKADEDGRFQVVSADWEPALPADFIGGPDPL